MTPSVPLPWFATKRVSPNTASPSGPSSPVMKLALITFPVLASYSLTTPAPRSRSAGDIELCAGVFSHDPQ